MFSSSAHTVASTLHNPQSSISQSLDLLSGKIHFFLRCCHIAPSHCAWIVSKALWFSVGRWAWTRLILAWKTETDTSIKLICFLEWHLFIIKICSLWPSRLKVLEFLETLLVQRHFDISVLHTCASQRTEVLRKLYIYNIAIHHPHFKGSVFNRCFHACSRYSYCLTLFRS